MKISFLASKPSTGAFLKYDSENQASIRIEADASQYKEVQKLNDLQYGTAFKITIESIKSADHLSQEII